MAQSKHESWAPGRRHVARLPEADGTEAAWPSSEIRYKSRDWRGPVQLQAQGIEFNIRYMGQHEHRESGRYPTHVHPHAELHYTLSGGGTIYIPERKLTIPCGPGCVVVMPANLPHYTTWQIAEPDERWQLVVVNFDLVVDIGKIMASAGEQMDLAFAPFYEWFFARQQTSLYICAEDRGPIDAIFRQMIASIDKTEYGLGSEIVAGLIREVSLFSRYLRKNGLADGQHLASPMLSKEAALLKARTLLEEGATPDSGAVSRIAAAVGMNESHFIRAFKQLHGITPKQYHLYVLMRRASALLAGTDMSVKEIAYTLGYEDPSSFSRAFKSFMGLSPSAYARQQRP